MFRLASRCGSSQIVAVARAQHHHIRRLASSLAPASLRAHLAPAAAARRASAAKPARAMAAAPAAAEAPPRPVEKLRADYAPVPYTVDAVELKFVLNEETSTCEAALRMAPLGAAGAAARLPLFLDGRADAKLLSIRVDGAEVPKEHYAVDARGVTLAPAAIPEAASWELRLVTELCPQDNSSLEGLYKSGGNFCTQCEAEGFRGIVPFLDRPDVMATYTTRIEADAARYPVLLSNGNLVEAGPLPGGRHFTVWSDPFRKPCYLFALVAGDLALTEDSFTTASGKAVALRIYTSEANRGKVAFAMESLKRAMAWDERTFGLEYDLELFNIVAVDDFNMGAMENKSLNVFNSRLVSEAAGF